MNGAYLVKKTSPLTPALLFPTLAALSAWMLSACISDGANHTGQDLLESRGIVLQEPLYQVDLQDFPLDSLVFEDAEQATEANRFEFLTGTWRGHVAKARLSFRLEEPKRFADLPENGLKLSLAYRKYSRGIGYLETTRDSAGEIRLLARVFRKPIAKNESGKLLDNADEWRNFVLSWMDLEDVDVTEDTLVLKPSSGYDSDSLQALPLPRLLSALRAEEEAMQIHIHLEPLVTDSGETGTDADYIARLAANQAGRARPHLLLGDISNAYSKSDSWQKTTISSSLGTSAVGFRVFGGSDGLLQRWPRRNLVYFLNRDSLMARLSAALPSEYASKESGGLGLGYFVPYAEAEWNFADSLIEVEVDAFLNIRMEFATASNPDNAQFRLEPLAPASGDAGDAPGYLVSERKNKLTLPITQAAQNWLNQANPDLRHMLRLIVNGAADSAYQDFPYPVFGTLPESGPAGNPTLDIRLHLHPLRDR